MPTKDPVFQVGQNVVATGGYNWHLTKGKQYKVIDYTAECVTETFTWPVYVTVIGDAGKPVTGHAHRFRALRDDETPEKLS